MLSWDESFEIKCSGYDAATNHEGSNTNPYPLDSEEGILWLKGWMECYEEAFN